MNKLSSIFIFLIFYFSVSIFPHEQKLYEIKNFSEREFGSFIRNNRIKVPDIEKIVYFDSSVSISSGLLRSPYINKDTFTNFILLELKNKMPNIKLTKPSAGIINEKNVSGFFIWIAGFYQEDDSCFYTVDFRLLDNRFTYLNVYEDFRLGYCGPSSLNKNIREAISGIIEKFSVKHHKLD